MLVSLNVYGRVTLPYLLLQESHAAQLQILMEFLKVARRNKREVICFVFHWVRWCLVLSSSTFLFKWCVRLALFLRRRRQGMFGEISGRGCIEF